MICGIGSKIDTKAQLKASSAQLKSWGRRAQGSLHLLMALTLVDAIFLCAFYAIIAYCFAPFVLKQDTSFLPYCYLALIPIASRFVVRWAIAKIISHISFCLEGAIREELIAKLLRVGPLSFAVKSSLSTLFVDALDDIMPYFTSSLFNGAADPVFYDHHWQGSGAFKPAAVEADYAHGGALP